MPAERRLNAACQAADRIQLLPWKRAHGLGIHLCCLLFCFAAFGTDPISRTFNYKGFDANGSLFVEGTITLHVVESNQVKGEWKFRVLDRNKLKEAGPQDGSGKIVGQLKEERIFLNLNPDEFGDNVCLEGRITKANIFKISGKWGRYGYYLGKMNEGNFEMVRRLPPTLPNQNAPFRKIAPQVNPINGGEK